MKPVYLRFCAFGPYVNEQIIDFKELSKAGLFLICGETGSGKTAILDAVTYALYGKSSGGGRGDISAMRCQLAPDSLNTEVEFIFEIHGRKYKFSRLIKCGRKNLNISQNALVLNDDGIFEPIFENPKIKDVESKAVELTGLDYEQFRQVVILPQGQFERLLVAKSSEKEEILVSLFGADKWQKTADIINEKVLEERRRLDNEKQSIERSLNDWDCQSFEQLSSLLSAKSDELKNKEEQMHEIASALLKIKKEYEKQNSIFEKFKSLEKWESTLELLKQREEEIFLLAGRLERADKADTIKPVFDNLENAENTLQKRKLQIKTEKEKLDECKSDLEKANDNLAELETLTPQNEENKLKLSILRGMEELYKKIDETKKNLKDAQDEYNALLKDVGNQTKAVSLLSDEKMALAGSEAAAYDEYTQMFNMFIGNMSGILAKELKKNKPCPVCGSKEHPSPADLSEYDVTNEMLEAKKAEIEEMRKAIKEKADVLERETESLAEKKDRLGNANVKKEKITSDYQNLLKSTDSVIKNTKELNLAVADLEKKILAFEAGLKKAKEDLVKIKTGYDTCSAAVAMLEKELEKEKNAYDGINNDFEKKMSQLLFASIGDFKDSLINEHEKSKLNNIITDYKVQRESIAKNVSDVKKELKDKKKPDIDELKKKMEQLENDNLNLTAEIAVRIKETEDLKELSLNLDDRIERYEKKNIICRDNQIFARHLCGVSGVSLQRYVLGVMLTSVAAEANRLLENVHNGRYKLFRTMETTGGTRKAGLELEVFDSLSGERRSVVSLSGGEKFLVALSLSIGLSSVVQAQSGGIMLDAMFIDEGFGSLDNSSIADALTVLSGINKSNRLVGIISHVSTLKENIDAKIEVSKNRTGSNLAVRF